MPADIIGTSIFNNSVKDVLKGCMFFFSFGYIFYFIYISIIKICLLCYTYI